MSATMSTSPQTPMGPRNAILDAAIEAITRGGEASVRITEVARAAGVTQGMVSYYFKDREGLITEAQIARYLKVIENDQAVIRQAAEHATTPIDFQNRMYTLISRLVTAERHENRRLRTSVLGSAMNRPQLMARVIDEQSVVTDRLGDVLTIAQHRGLLRSDINPRAIAEFVTAYVVGLVVVDADPHQTSDEDKIATFNVFLEALRP